MQAIDCVMRVFSAALTSAPLFFIAAAVSDPRVLVSLKKTQDRAFALSVSKAPWLDITCEEPW